MSCEPEQRLGCQNCQKLYEKVERIESLVQQLLFEWRQTNPHPNPASASDDYNNESDDDDFSDRDDDTEANDSPNKENGIEDNMSPHCEERPASTTIFCPHPDCSEKPPYSQKRNMTRHFTNHVSCRETCVFCSRPFSKVRQYITHFGKCKARNSKNANLKRLSKIATKRMQFLHQKTTQELNEKSENARNLDKVQIGKKRKLDNAMTQPQRRGSVAEDVPNSDINDNITLRRLSTNAVLASPSVHDLSQWNECEDNLAARASQLPTNLANTRPHLGQYAESSFRAPFIDARTLDWSYPYLIGSNGGTDSFAEPMGVNMGGFDLRESTNGNIGLTTFYQVEGI